MTALIGSMVTSKVFRNNRRHITRNEYRDIKPLLDGNNVTLPKIGSLQSRALRRLLPAGLILSHRDFDSASHSYRLGGSIGSLRDKGWTIVNHDEVCLTKDIVKRKAKFTRYELFAEFTPVLAERIKAFCKAVDDFELKGRMQSNIKKRTQYDNTEKVHSQKINADYIKYSLKPLGFYSHELPSAPLRKQGWNDGGICPFQHDGLMKRLELAVWPDEPECWQLIDAKRNKATKERAFLIVQALAELDFTQYGAVKGEHDDRPYFRFDVAGQSVFNEWLTDLQTIKIHQEENPLMAEHFGKFRLLMPSLALIFHCIDLSDGKVNGNVSAQATSLAFEWCQSLESHVRRIYVMAESLEHEAAVRLADKIKFGALLSPFTTKVVYRKCWHGLKDRQEVEAACNVLIEENWLMMTRKPKPESGRPPLPEYLINPFFL